MNEKELIESIREFIEDKKYTIKGFLDRIEYLLEKERV